MYQFIYQTTIIRKCLTFLVITLLPVLSYAEVLSYKQGLEIIIKNSPQWELSRQSILASEAQKKVENALSNPSLNIDREQLSDGGEDYTETAIGLEKTFDIFGSYWADRTSSHYLFRADSMKAEWELQRTVWNYKKSYLEGLLSLEKLDILVNQKKLLKEILNIANARYQENSLTEYDLFQVRSKMMEVEVEIAEVNRECLELTQRISNQIFTDNKSITLTSDDRPNPVSLDSGVLVETGLKNNLEMKIHQEVMEHLSYKKRAQSLSRLPDINLRASYKNQDDGYSGIAYGASLELPLFNLSNPAGRQTKAKQSTLRIQSNQRKKELSARLQALVYEHIELRKISKNMNEPQALSIMNFSTGILLRFKEGQRDIFETLESLEDLFLTSRKIREITYNQLYNQIEIEFLIGGELL